MAKQEYYIVKDYSFVTYPFELLSALNVPVTVDAQNRLIIPSTTKDADLKVILKYCDSNKLSLYSGVPKKNRGNAILIIL